MLRIFSLKNRLVSQQVRLRFFQMILYLGKMRMLRFILWHLSPDLVRWMAYLTVVLLIPVILTSCSSQNLETSTIFAVCMNGWMESYTLFKIQEAFNQLQMLDLDTGWRSWFWGEIFLVTNLQQAVHVNSDKRTVTFRISGETKSDQITLVLPIELIENPNAFGLMVLWLIFRPKTTTTGTKLIIPISPHSEEIKVMGTRVIPEFGFLALGVLSVGLVSTFF